MSVNIEELKEKISRLERELTRNTGITRGANIRGNTNSEQRTLKKRIKIYGRQTNDINQFRRI